MTPLLSCAIFISVAFQSAAAEELDRDILWQSDTTRLVTALRDAEAFRQRLIAHAPEQEANACQAFRLGIMLANFRELARPPLGRPHLGRFTVTAESFAEQLRGEQTAADTGAFVAFRGRWYGHWGRRRVDHVWTAVQTEPRLEETAKERSLRPTIETQYAWIGDGFGWNLLVQPNNAPGKVLLGHVFHVAPEQPRLVHRQYPLVGYADGPQRVIWVTPEYAFFEEVHQADSAAGERYSITGFQYESVESAYKLRRKPFQAIYTRQDAVRPAWIEFPMPPLLNRAPR